MPIRHADYNAFAEGLADRFAARAKGLDEDSQQILGIRPADHVLAGFLTAVTSIAQPQVDGDMEQALTDDLPRDTAYEQTSIGVEWIAPAGELREGVRVEITARVHVYARRLPSFEQQRDRASWKVPYTLHAKGRSKTGEQRTGEQGTPERTAHLIPKAVEEPTGPAMQLGPSVRRVCCS